LLVVAQNDCQGACTPGVLNLTGWDPLGFGYCIFSITDNKYQKTNINISAKVSQSDILIKL